MVDDHLLFSNKSIETERGGLQFIGSPISSSLDLTSCIHVSAVPSGGGLQADAVREYQRAETEA